MHCATFSGRKSQANPYQLQELVGWMDLGHQDPKPLPPSLTHLRISLQADFWQDDSPEQVSAAHTPPGNRRR